MTEIANTWKQRGKPTAHAPVCRYSRFESWMSTRARRQTREYRYTITATAATATATATDTMIMMIYTGYEEHITKTRISQLVFMVDTKLIANTKAEPQNQLKTPVSMSITNSAVGIATRYGDWTVRGFSAPVQTGPGAHPAPCTMGTWSFPGVKKPGRSVDHLPAHSADVKERVELYLYSTSGPS